eukprot:gene28154-37123_t
MLSLLAALGLSALSAVAPAHAQDKSIVVASTTSTQDSGLFNYLLPIFKAKTGIDVKVIAQGTGRGVGPALFEESVVPLCAPRLAEALHAPSDLSGLTLLTVDYADPSETATTDWEPWLRVMGLADLRMKSTLRFTHY